MPLSFTIDPDGLVRSKAIGPLTDDCFAAHTEALKQKLDHHPARELMDLSSAEAVEVTGGGVRMQVERDQSAVRDGAVSGTPRIAIVTDREVLFGLSRMYQILHDNDDFEVGVFRDSEEAEAWLSASLSTEAALSEES